MGFNYINYMKKPSEFFNYINKPLSNENLNMLYSTNNIIFERSNLFQDFTLSLIDLVCETYMGDDITNDDEKIKHFDWCWEKTINSFLEEDVDFRDNGELYEYFINFVLETFYMTKPKTDMLHFNMLKLWSYLFGITIPKTRSDVDTFMEIYRLFDKSLIKPKKKVKKA